MTIGKRPEVRGQDGVDLAVGLAQLERDLEEGLDDTARNSTGLSAP